MRPTQMTILPRLFVTSHSIPQPLKNALLAVTIGLTVSLAACTSNTTTSTNTAPTGTEETAAADGSLDNIISPTPKVYAKDGIAIGGADPVAYFTEETFVEGSPDFSHEWQGVTWQFASAENRDLFASAPEEYAPQYGGHCAWAVAARNTLVPIDPNAWSVVDGKLYLNANKKVQSNWDKDRAGFIAQADEKWPALSVQ
ncbi:MAG: YHS domain-containing (seleno)protein [Cyanobacteria bacterium P01_F01_bin.53]